MEDLDLTFSVSDASLGRSSSIDLIPGGSNIIVTSSNRQGKLKIKIIIIIIIIMISDNV